VHELDERVFTAALRFDNWVASASASPLGAHRAVSPGRVMSTVGRRTQNPSAVLPMCFPIEFSGKQQIAEF
jgi:hypothetical protein